jgi:hypothetical protein
VVSQTAAHQPFPDLNVLGSGTAVETIDTVDVAVGSEPTTGALNPVRGIVLGLLLCSPFWIIVYWMLT